MNDNGNKINTPVVSVIIITYNQEDTIAQAIDSVLLQKVDFPYEIILADDASIDRTSAICEHYQSRFPDTIRYVRNKKNKGAVKNYFDAFSVCRGEYIADCAGDDFWIGESRLQEQVEYMREHPAVMMVHANWRVYDTITGNFTLRARDSRYDPGEKIQTGEDSIIKLLHQRGTPYVIPATGIYRFKPVYEFYGRHTALFRDYLCEDIQLAAVCMHLGEVHYLDRETMVYRVGRPSVSNQWDTEKAFRFSIDMFRLRYALARCFNLDMSRLKPYSKKQFALIMRYSVRAGKGEYAREAYRLIKENSESLSVCTRLLYWGVTDKVLSPVIYFLYGKLRKVYHLFVIKNKL